MSRQAPDRYVNLDYAASTPMRPEASAAQAALDASELAGANPNSLHTLGRRAAARLEEARANVARTFGTRVRPSEIIFTGGGTEANHLALLGIAEGVREHDHARTRVVVSAIEHDSILDNLPALRARGFTVQTVKPCRAGYVEPTALEELMGPDVALVSIMFANNETGVVQPVADLARVAHDCGARFHTDAIQGWLHLPLDVDELGVDACSAAGHKVGGPAATGVLYVRSRTPIHAQVMGGGQERGLRAGTQDLRSIVALEAAATSLYPRVGEDAERLGRLSSRLYEQLSDSPRIHPTMGDPGAVRRLPGIVSVWVDDIDSEELILKLDALGFEVSAASACSSGSLDPSHVLLAMGVPRDSALGSLRISFDDRVDPSDLDRFAEALLSIVEAS